MTRILGRVLEDLKRMTRRGAEGAADMPRGAARYVRSDLDEKLHADRHGAYEIRKAGEGLRTQEHPGVSPVDDIPSPPRPIETPFETVNLDPKYAGEDKPGNTVFPGFQVKYLTEDERRHYEIRVVDGKLYNAENEPYDTYDAKGYWGAIGTATFVMDQNGRLYSSLISEPGRFHHSSYLAGEPVAGARIIHVENGTLKRLWADDAGHYKPSRSMAVQVVRHLRNLGVSMDDVKILLRSKDNLFKQYKI
ncbi:hypothetical protein [Nocardia araoensis]|uniref:hypothetical protein n=1 Tax=Nocardia araoensis TaxID=228600 RepID=UPI0012F6E9D2|nr:hypothetical protein [Nocardia araoensis]